jgi:Fe2+ or Zn2+ uptake regulation protein
MASQWGAAQLREWLLAALDDTDGTLTTAELRDYVQRRADRAGKDTVIESVYRNLTVLERRGDVVRRPGPGRDAHWAAATQRSARDRPA